MTEQDIKNKNLVLISYLNTLIDGYKIKAEYSTNDNDVKVIVVTETSGEKIVFFNNDVPLFNYYDIQIFGDNIQDAKNTSVIVGNLIGKSVIVTYKGQTWQLIFKQFANPRTIEFMDIRRVAYTTTLKCIVNRVA
jgi:hypothetical protein